MPRKNGFLLNPMLLNSVNGLIQKRIRDYILDTRWPDGSIALWDNREGKSWPPYHSKNFLTEKFYSCLSFALIGGEWS